MDKKPLIVGIDPGNTSAVAAFDFNGNNVLLESQKEFSRDEIIRKIVESGIPVVIASDKEKMPSSAKKIARSVGAEKFEPENDLGKDRKRKLGEGENSHEIDAYASGLHAFNSLQREIRKVKKHSGSTGEESGKVAKRYFSRNILEGENSEKPEKSTSKNSSLNDTSELKSKLGEITKRNRELENRVEKLEEDKLNSEIESKEIRRLEEIILEKNQDIHFFREKINSLENQKEELIDALRKVRKGYEPIPKINYHTEEIPEKAVTESKELSEKLQRQGYNVRTVEEVEGLEVEHFVVVESFPEPESIRDLIDKDKSRERDV